MPRQYHRNARYIWYAHYIEAQDIYDEDGNYTGEIEPHYSEPKRVMACVSGVSGEYSGDSSSTTFEPMGIHLGPVRHVDITGRYCPLRENDAVWVDSDYETEPHNYIVTKVDQGTFDARINIRRVR